MTGRPLRALSRAEARLLYHVRRGTELDLVGVGAVDAAAMRGWGAAHEVRADVIRDVLRGSRVGADPRGLRLRGATVVGTLDLEGLSTSIILSLSECYLPQGLVARDAHLCVLKLCGCRIEAGSGPGVDAARLVATMVVLNDASVAGRGPDGAVDVRGARLIRLDCDGARLANDSGPALHGDSLRVEHEVFMRRGFVATGAGEDGAVCLRGARMARLECDGAKLRNSTGPALRADSLQVDQRAFLRRGFDAEGAGEHGAVRLNGARLGLFASDGATVRNSTGPALLADAMHVERGVLCGPGFVAVGVGDRAVVSLIGTRVGGRLLFDTGGLRHVDGNGPLLAVDDLTYAGMPEGTTVQEWLHLLGTRTAAYTPQPYQQLAAVCRAAGQDREARTVLIAQRKDEIRRGNLAPATRAWLRLTSWTLGYGYRPWLALLWLAAVVAVAVAAALYAGATGGLAHPGSSSPCSLVERAGVGLDLSVPLVKTGAREFCRPTATPAGQGLTVAGWGLLLLGWSFGTLFVAGFTGAVRKTG